MKKSMFLLLAVAFSLSHLFGCSSTKQASYHYTQKQLERGELDFENRLRVDEYVNAFPQEGLAKPKAGRDVDVRVDFMTDSLTASSGKTLAQVAVRSRDATDAEKAKKQGLVFVLDVSGSMEEDNKFLDAIEATLALVSELSDGTEFALVTFSSSARVVIEPTIVSQTTRTEIKEKIKTLGIHGGTNIEAGLVVGYKTLASLKEAKNARLLLLTDGNSNVGSTDPQELAKKAGVQYQEGARISTIGLGHDVDENLLRTIATSGQGAYHFAENARSLKTLFLKESASLMIPVAKNVRVQIVTSENLSQVYGYPRPAGNEFKSEIGELNSDDWRIFIVELDVDPKAKDFIVEAGVSYDRISNGVHEGHKAIAQIFVNAKKKPKVDPVVARNAVIFSNALALIEISKLDKAGKHADAVNVVDIQLANMEVARDWDKSPEFTKEFDNLERVKRILQDRAGIKNATAPATPPPSGPNYKKWMVKGALALVEKSIAGPWGLVLGILTFAID